MTQKVNLPERIERQSAKRATRVDTVRARRGFYKHDVAAVVAPPPSGVIPGLNMTAGSNLVYLILLTS